MFRFFLTYQGARTEVEEPKGVFDVDSTLSRDFETHGCFFEYTQRNLKLGFICEGRRILEEAYQAEGTNAIVIFEAESRDQFWEEWVLEYSMRAQMTTRNYSDEYFEVAFFRDDLASDIKNNNEVTLDLSAEKDLKGNVLEPLEYKQLLLNSKLIVKKSIFKINEAYTADNTFQSANIFSSTYIIPWQVKAQDVEGTIEPTPGERGGNNLFQSSNFFFSGLFSGNEKRTIFLTAYLRFSIKIAFNGIYTYGVELVRYKLDSGESEVVHTATSGTFQSSPAGNSTDFKSITANIANLQVDIQSNEVLIFQLRFFSGASIFGQTVTINFDKEYSSMDFYENTTTENTACNGYFLYDLINRAFEIVTGNREVVKSDLLNTGAARNLFSTNGYQIRGFVERVIQFNIKDAIRAIAAIFNTGWGIEGDPADPATQKVVIEPMGYFYAGEEIMIFEHITDYHEQPAEQYLINQLIIGYEKFAEDESETNTIDEPLSRHEYLLPLNSVKAKKEILCPWILSPYLIEFTRREQFKDKATESGKYDDDMFLINTTELTIDPITFKNILGQTYVSKSFTIIIPEHDEPFDQIYNLIDPKTCVNLRYTPKRMLLNWGEYLNSFLYFNSVEDVYSNQRVRNNGELTTRFRATEPDKLGDEQNFSRREDESVRISDCFSARKQFAPDFVYFKATLCREDLDFIVQAHQNRLTGVDEDKNYGYISVYDNDGKIQAGYIMNMEWNRLKREIDFTLLKKAGPATSPATLPGLLQETLGYDFITTESGIVISLE